MNVAVVCCYFNFTGSPFRYKNYNIFQKNIRKHDIKLLTVEFSPTKDFELNKEDTDVLIQLSDGDIMWQKERLLNIGIEQLPPDTDIVIIADTDIIIGREDFVEKLEETLKTYKVVQCFSDTLVFNPILELDENVNFFKLNHNLTYNYCNSGISVVRDYIDNKVYDNVRTAYGLAWAFRYDILKKMRLFDHNIIGSGDKLLFGTLFNIMFKHEVAGVNFNPYIEYARNALSHVNGKEVSYLKDTTIYSLYHGEFVNRKYLERHNILKHYQFNSINGLIDRPNLPYKFSDSISDELKKEIEIYFINRKDNLPLPPCLY
jgi:hypothetical protein